MEKLTEESAKFTEDRMFFLLDIAEKSSFAYQWWTKLGKRVAILRKSGIGGTASRKVGVKSVKDLVAR